MTKSAIQRLLARSVMMSVRGSFPEVVAKIFVGLVVASVAGLGLFNRYDVIEWWQRQSYVASSGQNLTVLVASLAADPDRSQTRHVMDTLEEALDVGRQPAPLQARRYPATLEVNANGDLSEELRNAQAEGRRWLARANADLLIWGDVAAKDRTLRLRFLPRAGNQSATAKPYNLNDVLELPKDFTSEFGAALAAVAAASVEPGVKGGSYIGDVLRPALRKLAPLVEHPPPGLNADQTARLRNAYALASASLGEQSGDKEAFETAVQNYHQVLATWTRQKNPLDWARTQNNLGISLWQLGQKEAQTTKLREAAAAHRAALQEITRDASPVDWARTQNNLAIVLRELGRRDNDIASLDQSVDAYRSAYQEFARNNEMLDAARAQVNLAISLQDKAERETGTANLEEAVENYRQSIPILKRSVVPLDWARAQNGLAYALSYLGERTGTIEPLQAGLTVCRSALEEERADQVPIDWAATQDTCARLLMLLADKTNALPLAQEAKQKAMASADAFAKSGDIGNTELSRNRIADITRLIGRLESQAKPGTAATPLP